MRKSTPLDGSSDGHDGGGGNDGVCLYVVHVCMQAGAHPYVDSHGSQK